MRIAAGILIAIIIALVVGCATPSTTPVSVPEPAIPAHYTIYVDKAGLFSISYPSHWELGLSLIEGKTVFVAGKPYQDGYNPNVSITLLPYKQTLLLPYQPINESDWKLEDFVEVKVQEEIKYVAKDYHEFSRTKIVVGGKDAILLDSESITLGIHIRSLKMYMRNDKLVWMVICGVLPASNFSDYETDFHAVVRSLRILK